MGIKVEKERRRRERKVREEMNEKERFRFYLMLSYRLCPAVAAGGQNVLHPSKKQEICS